VVRLVSQNQHTKHRKSIAFCKWDTNCFLRSKISTIDSKKSRGIIYSGRGTSVWLINLCRKYSFKTLHHVTRRRPVDMGTIYTSYNYWKSQLTFWLITKRDQILVPPCKKEKTRRTCGALTERGDPHGR